MSDPTEEIRRQMVAEINEKPEAQQALELKHQQRVYTSDEVLKDYEILGFMAPFIVVKRRSDGVKGSMMFQHWPRYYWGFQEDA